MFICYFSFSDLSKKILTLKSRFRCVVLFPMTLLILEITSNVNSYILKKRIALDKFTLKKADNKATLILYNGKFLLTITVDKLVLYLDFFCMTAPSFFLKIFNIQSSLHLMVRCGHRYCNERMLISSLSFLITKCGNSTHVV